MHANELDISVGLVTALVDEQFPAWGGLALTRVDSYGTDNALFRVGDELVIRLPRLEGAVGGAIREYEWLPHIAPHVPLAVPRPAGRGQANEDYPWPWFAYRWIEGRNPDLDEVDDLVDALAEFVNAMRRIESTGAPEGWRGRPLATQTDALHRWIAAQDDTVDTEAALQVWERALGAKPWTGRPVWFHGDLMRGNLLVRDGRLNAVIDFATAGAGDPAIDLLPAWALFDAETRARFRAAVAADDAMWERSRGWAVLVALGAVAYYRETNELLYSTGRRALDALLS